MKNLHFAFWIVPLIVLGLLEGMIFRVAYFYWFLIAINVLLILVVALFYYKGKTEDKFYNFLIFPLLLANSLVSYVIFIKTDSGQWLIQLLFIIGTIFLYLYLKFLYLFLFKPNLYTPTSLENLSLYGNFLTVFLFFSSLYGRQSFLDMPVWQIALIVLFVMAASNHQLLWSNKISFKTAVPYVLISSLLLVELVWVASFLTFNFNISGFIIALCYYNMTGFIRLYLTEKLDKNNLKIYLSISLASIVLILLTAQWI